MSKGIIKMGKVKARIIRADGTERKPSIFLIIKRWFLELKRIIKEL